MHGRKCSCFGLFTVWNHFTMETNARVRHLRRCKVFAMVDFHLKFNRTSIICFFLWTSFIGEASTRLLPTKMQSMFSAETMVKVCWMIWYDSMWRTNHGAELVLRSWNHCPVTIAQLSSMEVRCTFLGGTRVIFTPIPISPIKMICLNTIFNPRSGANGNLPAGKWFTFLLLLDSIMVDKTWLRNALIPFH